MALSVVQTTTPVLTDAGGATTTLTFASTPTAGNAIVVWYINAGGANPVLDPTLADNKGNTPYVKAISANEPGAGQLAGVYYLGKITTTSATFTVTVTHNATTNNFTLITMSEIGTAGLGITLDKTASNTITTGTPLVITAAALAQATELITSSITVNGSVANQGIGTAFTAGTQVMVEQNDSLHVAGAGDYKLTTTSENSASYAITAAHTDAVGVFASFFETAAPTPNSKVDGLNSFNRPGRGPFSLGAFYVADYTAYTTPTVAPVVGGFLNRNYWWDNY